MLDFHCDCAIFMLKPNQIIYIINNLIRICLYKCIDMKSSQRAQILSVSKAELKKSVNKEQTSLQRCNQ